MTHITQEQRNRLADIALEEGAECSSHLMPDEDSDAPIRAYFHTVDHGIEGIGMTINVGRGDPEYLEDAWRKTLRDKRIELQSRHRIAT